MKPAHEKYIPFVPLKMTRRAWPDRELKAPPVWCSVDLRDGNQALIDPMNVREKLELFHTLVDIGVKEIEVGFPSASETEYEFIRTLIEGGHIPDDVTIQVLVQAREHLIRRTFEAIDGAKHVIFHFYNSTSTLQRKVVFHTDVEGVKKIAVDAARLIRELSQPALDAGMDLRYEYSPESFMGTEMDAAVEICQAVIEAIGATPERKVILNLPTTVENCMPNYFADEIEYFISRLPGRDRAIISLHPHNDRGEGVATAELGLLAGAERVEATLFGNGERTGNVDMVTLALNLYTQGVDPKLDFSDINKIRDVYRQYEPIIRINSQSGKGGSAFVMQHSFGFDLPKAMHPEFGHIVQVETDRVGKELKPNAIYDLFKAHYIDAVKPYQLVQHSFAEFTDEEGHSHVTFAGTIRHTDTVFQVQGSGNGPIDAFFNAIHGQKMDRFTFIDYKEHAVKQGSDSQAVAYIHLQDENGRDWFGVGMSHNINLAPLKGILSAINRAVSHDGK